MEKSTSVPLSLLTMAGQRSQPWSLIVVSFCPFLTVLIHSGDWASPKAQQVTQTRCNQLKESNKSSKDSKARHSLIRTPPVNYYHRPGYPAAVGLRGCIPGESPDTVGCKLSSDYCIQLHSRPNKSSSAEDVNLVPGSSSTAGLAWFRPTQATPLRPSPAETSTLAFHNM
jgi:hypothetical protein